MHTYRLTPQIHALAKPIPALLILTPLFRAGNTPLALIPLDQIDNPFG